MHAIGRNEPGACGSGARQRRCCLEDRQTALRVAGELEAQITVLGAEVRRRAPGAWTRELDRLAA